MTATRPFVDLAPAFLWADFGGYQGYESPEALVAAINADTEAAYRACLSKIDCNLTDGIQGGSSCARMELVNPRPAVDSALGVWVDDMFTYWRADKILHTYARYSANGCENNTRPGGEAGLSASFVCPAGYAALWESFADRRYKNVVCRKYDDPPMQCEDGVGNTAGSGAPGADGNPIQRIDGTKTEAHTDYASASGLLRVEREFNGQRRGWRMADSARGLDLFSSDVQAVTRARLGVTETRKYTTNGRVRNVTLSFPYVRSSYDGSFRLIHHDGSSSWYSVDPSDPSGRRFLANVGGSRMEKLDSPTPEGALWRRVRTDNVVEEYGTDGRLRKMQRPDGPSTTWQYSGERLVKTKDSFGREALYSYDTTGKLSSVTLPDSQRVSYGYENGLLSSVTYPGSRTRRYAYNEPAFLASSGTPAPFSLTGAFDEENVRIGTYRYDSSGRASSTESANGVNRYDFSFGSTYTAVTSPLGAKNYYYFTTTANSVKALSYQSQPAGSGCGPASNSLTYDARGNITSRKDFVGNYVIYKYDTTRNLETVRVEGLATPTATLLNPGASLPAGSRKISTEWHPYWRLATREASPLTLTITVHNGQPDPTAGNATLTCAPASARVNDQPIAVVCKRVEQATLDANGSQGFAASYDPSTPARVWSHTYNADGQVLTAKDPRGKTVSYAYYADTTGDHRRGDLQTITDPIGHVTRFMRYDVHGHPLEVVDANNVVTRFTYDERQRLIERLVRNPSTGTDEMTGIRYNAIGKLERVTHPDGEYIEYEYDDAHRLTLQKSSVGTRKLRTLDNAGNVTREDIYAETGVLVGHRVYEYDLLGRLKKVKMPSGAEVQYEYDANGNPKRVVGPQGQATDLSYDRLNRRFETTLPEATVGAGRPKVTLGYNGQSALTRVTDPRDLLTEYAKDGLSRLTQLTSPDTGVSTQPSFDEEGNVLRSVDARGNQTDYRYDVLGRVTSMTNGDGTTTFTYDTATYGKRRPASITDPSGTTQFAYDFQGRSTRQTQLIAAWSRTFQTEASYDSAGRLTRTTTPSGRSVGYNYSRGQLSAMTLDGASLLDSATYTPWGEISGWRFANGIVHSRVFDGDMQLERLELADTTKHYQRDASGRITAISDSSRPADNWSYAYDALDQLTHEVSTALTNSYTYDKNGNRLTVSGAGASSTYTYPATSHRLASITGAGAATYTHDASGNITGDGRCTYDYNDTGRMRSASCGTTTTTYRYNALGQRVAKTVASPTGSVTTLFAWDAAGRLVGEYDPSGNPIREYLWMGSIPVALLHFTSPAARTVYYVHTDHLATPRQLTNAAQRVVWAWKSDAFGNGAPNQDPDGDGVALVYNLRFSGQFFDAETGLHQNYFRDYDPRLGRYIQSDPIGLSGGNNLYVYVRNNPSAYVDPDGLLGRSPKDPPPPRWNDPPRNGTHGLWIVQDPNGLHWEVQICAGTDCVGADVSGSGLYSMKDRPEYPPDRSNVRGHVPLTQDQYPTALETIRRYVHGRQAEYGFFATNCRNGATDIVNSAIQATNAHGAESSSGFNRWLADVLGPINNGDTAIGGINALLGILGHTLHLPGAAGDQLQPGSMSPNPLDYLPMFP